MLDAFRATLEATNPARDCFRAYHVEAGTDLLGDWVVEVTFGRIGSRGRVAGEPEARRLVRATVRKRAAAEPRIGVAYRLKELCDPAAWLGPGGSEPNAKRIEGQTERPRRE